jgi:hypothetical protein
VRGWREPVDLPLLSSEPKYKWSLAPVEADVDSATHDMETETECECGDGGEPTVYLLRTHTRLWCCCSVRRWREPVDLRLLRSQTKYNWSLALVEADVDSATHDMETECGAYAYGEPKLDLFKTHTRL